MGSWMVMSLNCPRAAYKADHDDQKLIDELKYLMNKSVEVFRVKKKWMDHLLASNRIPFAAMTPRDPNTGEKGAIAVDFAALVYTIGVVGINEMVQYHTGKSMYESPDSFKFAIRIMYEMKLHAQRLSQENGIEIALARTPAETTAQRFAVSDLLHPEYAGKAENNMNGDVELTKKELGTTKDLPVYYTNGTHIPPGADISVIERINYEQTFFPIVDGGNILHIWLGEGTPDPDGLQEMAMHIAKNTATGYFAFTRDITICKDEGYVTSGIKDSCPKCGSENIDHLSRITGYLQSVDGWNAGKRQELVDRTRADPNNLKV
jgi:ribonucleoside-triphosphate reductase